MESPNNKETSRHANERSSVASMVNLQHEIEYVLKKNEMTYEPPNPVGWTFKPSWRFGRIYLSPQTFDDLLRFATKRLGIDESKFIGRKPTLQVVENEHAIMQLTKILEEDMGANRYRVGEIINSIYRAEEALVTAE